MTFLTIYIASLVHFFQIVCLFLEICQFSQRVVLWSNPLKLQNKDKLMKFQSKHQSRRQERHFIYFFLKHEVTEIPYIYICICICICIFNEVVSLDTSSLSSLSSSLHYHHSQLNLPEAQKDFSPMRFYSQTSKTTLFGQKRENVEVIKCIYNNSRTTPILTFHINSYLREGEREPIYFLLVNLKF